MHKLVTILTFAAALFLTGGCQLLRPKPVELFQTKVKAVPQLSNAAKEHQRQAAELLARTTRQTEAAALAEHSSTNVTVPAQDARDLAGALSQSLGPSQHHWYSPKPDTQTAVTHLQRDEAKLNKQLTDYRESVAPDVGKKIEGTGLFKIGYFTMWGLILGFLMVVWLALKIYGLANPLVGTATATVGRVGSLLVNKAFHEVVAGGQKFKDLLVNSDLPQEAVSTVKSLFTQAQLESQSQDTQKLTTALTQPPSPPN